MGAKVIRISAAAAMTDHEPHVQRLRLFGSLPGFAEQAGLFDRRERCRLADVHIGRSEADDRPDDRVDHVARGDDHEADWTSDAFGEHQRSGGRPTARQRERRNGNQVDGVADEGEGPIPAALVGNIPRKRPKRITKKPPRPAVMLTIAALAPSVAMNGPLMLAPPS